MMPDLAADYSELMFRIRGAETFFNHRNDALKAYVAAPPTEHTQKQAGKLLKIAAGVSTAPSACTPPTITRWS